MNNTHNTPIHSGNDSIEVYDFCYADDCQAIITRKDNDVLFTSQTLNGRETHQVREVRVFWSTTRNTEPCFFTMGPRLRKNGEDFTTRWYEDMLGRFEDIPADVETVWKEIAEEIRTRKGA